jgi:hypothetical protein
MKSAISEQIANYSTIYRRQHHQSLRLIFTLVLAYPGADQPVGRTSYSTLNRVNMSSISHGHEASPDI